MSESRFLTELRSKIGFVFLTGQQVYGDFFNKFAHVPLNKNLMAHVRVYYS